MKDNMDFKEKINNFINCSQDKNKIRAEYLKLIKEFHPDTNRELNKEIANEYMIIINYLYEQLIHNKNNSQLFQMDEYEKNKINGKYCFINEFGIKEFISDKILYMYKLGRLEYSKAYIIMHKNPSFLGNKEETGYEIIEHLYKAYKYFKDVIEMDKTGSWVKEAKRNLYYAYKMNEHITRGLKATEEKGIIKI
jgi:curved DNA-binding protein CbpA